MIGLLRMLHEGHGLSVRSRELLLRFLTETSTGSRCIRGLLPPVTRVAHKTGSSSTVNRRTSATMMPVLSHCQTATTWQSPCSFAIPRRMKLRVKRSLQESHGPRGIPSVPIAFTHSDPSLIFQKPGV